MNTDVAREHVHREAQYLSQWGSFPSCAVEVPLTVAQTERVLSELGYVSREGLWVRVQ